MADMIAPASIVCAAVQTCIGTIEDTYVAEWFVVDSLVYGPFNVKCLEKRFAISLIDK